MQGGAFQRKGICLQSSEHWIPQHITVVTGSHHSGPSQQPRDMVSSLCLPQQKGMMLQGPDTLLQEHLHSNIWAPNRRCSWHMIMYIMGLQNPTASCSRVGPAQAGSSGQLFQWDPVISEEARLPLQQCWV